MIKIPFWRVWLSYLWEQRLEETSSDYNDYLLVSLVQGRLQLTAREAIYSFGDYYLNFRNTFERFRFSSLPDQAEVLVLGLGLGSIPELLYDRLAYDYRFVAVEIDPVIVDLAAAYSLPRLAAEVDVVTADAYAFLQIDERRFDLICMDVFQDATVPAELEDENFLWLLKETLAEGGALIFNRLASTEENRRDSLRFYEEKFLKMFPNATFFDTNGNLMLINEKKFLLSEHEEDLS